MAAFFLCTSVLAAQRPAAMDIKGLWIVRESMTSAREIDKALLFAAESGFNHVFVQVRGRGDAYYNSLIVPKSERIREPGFDPLEHAVARGHALGLNVHAWVTTYLLWSARQPPERSSHLYYLHPEWQEVDSRGRAHSEIDLSAPRSKGFEGIYLAPTHPEVNSYLQGIFTEIILHYEIDGLHLDYSRYYDFDYGYNAEALAVFERRHEFNPMTEIQTWNGSPAHGDADPLSRQMQLWNDYRRSKVTELITALHAIITISGREVMLSSAVKPDVNKARNMYYQDWVHWLDEGLLDFALPMNYSTSAADFRDRIGQIIRVLPQGYRKKVIMGVANYNQSPEDTAVKIRIAREYGFNSVCVFSYDSYKTNLWRFDPIIESMRP